MKFVSSNIDKSNEMLALLEGLVNNDGSDLFLAAGVPAMMKKDGELKKFNTPVLTDENIQQLLYTIMTEDNLKTFSKTQECNFALHNEHGRFRVNVHYQQGNFGSVIRRIKTDIPSLKELLLPETLSDHIKVKRGLILVCGATGSGKSSTLASLLDYRNTNIGGHILTIEDPIEFVHMHKKGIINQREIGIDTLSWQHALSNALRQAPDVIMIGEIRDAESMRHALTFADTGHLCVGTLHTNSASQAIERIINFFPEHRQQVLMELSMCLSAIISQRLLPKKSGQGRVPALEILTGSALVRDLIRKGELDRIKEAMEKSNEMKTFDNCLLELMLNGTITVEEGLRNADNETNLRIAYKERNPNFMIKKSNNDYQLV